MLLLLLIIEEWARLGHFDSNLDPRGHCMILSHVGCVFSTNRILGRAPCTKETLPDFRLNNESRKGGTIRAI